jgi:hypothetical protein
MPRLRIGGVASEQSQFEQFLTHPVKINHDTWSGSTLLSGVIAKDIVQLWKTSLSTNMAKKIASLWYFTATLRIRIVVQGSAQSFGKMYYTFTPRVQNVMSQPATGSLAAGQYHNCEIVPHLVVDPSKNETYELELPVCSPTGWYQIAATNNHGSYQLERFMLNQILSGTAQAGTCNICMYMSLVNPRFEGLTTGLSSDFVAEKKASDYVQTVSTMSALAAPVAMEFSPAVTLFSQVTGTLASVLRWFGFSKPPASEHHVFVTNRNCDNYSQIEGTSTAMVLGASQKQSMSIHPGYGNSTLDEMAVSTLLNKQSLLYTATITSASAAEAALSSFIRVSPMACYKYSGSSNPKSFSPMAMFGALSTYWCGDIIYRLEFVASVFTRASILIAWDPYNYSGTPPSFGDAVSILKNVTVQIVGNTAIDLRIPYKSYMPALLCGSLSAPNAADNEAFSNGTIYFFVVNPVQDNGSATPTMYMNVYARSDNMTFFAPSLDGNLDYTLDAEPYSNDFCPAANVDFGPKTDLSNIHTRIVGDSPRTVKDYALRMNKVTSGNVTGNNTGVINSLQLSSPNMPLTINDRTSTSATHNSYFAWMSSGFLGYRGSVRYSLKAWYTISPVSNTLTRFSYGVYHQTHGISAAAFVATAQHTSGNDLENAYAFTHMQDGISNRLDVAAPIIIPTDFLATRVQPNSSTDSLNFIATVEGSDGNLTSSAINYNLYQGCGDDGVFLWFLGFPMTTN